MPTGAWPADRLPITYYIGGLPVSLFFQARTELSEYRGTEHVTRAVICMADKHIKP